MIDLLDGAAANVKWIEPHDLHLTLKFLGEVRQRDVAGVCEAVRLAVEPVAPFQLELCGVGAFPNDARPRTVWIGAAGGDEEMVRLHDRIEAELAELGYREEHRRFKTHLTIGRVRGGGMGIAELGTRVKELAECRVGVMGVEKIAVFSSQLTPAGPIYEPLGSARLGGNSGGSAATRC